MEQQHQLLSMRVWCWIHEDDDLRTSFLQLLENDETWIPLRIMSQPSDSESWHMAGWVVISFKFVFVFFNDGLISYIRQHQNNQKLDMLDNLFN